MPGRPPIPTTLHDRVAVVLFAFFATAVLATATVAVVHRGAPPRHAKASTTTDLAQGALTLANQAYADAQKACDKALVATPGTAKVTGFTYDAAGDVTKTLKLLGRPTSPWNLMREDETVAVCYLSHTTGKGETVLYADAAGHRSVAPLQPAP